mmetsp:Transcript_46457/g.97225  ORF Transcript_46457/g.97225 Transcript_46457/m.97225 type:complete len:101 (-) Transcript_46457:867-1169(-)
MYLLLTTFSGHKGDVETRRQSPRPIVSSNVAIQTLRDSQRLSAVVILQDVTPQLSTGMGRGRICLGTDFKESHKSKPSILRQKVTDKHAGTYYAQYCVIC